MLMIFGCFLSNRIECLLQHQKIPNDKINLKEKEKRKKKGEIAKTRITTTTKK